MPTTSQTDKPLVVHEIRVFLVKECDHKTLSPAAVKGTLQRLTEGSDYGHFHVREVTTRIDGHEEANKLFDIPGYAVEPKVI
jgi:hypothetical protein